MQPDIPTLDFGLLGPLTVRVDGRPVSVGGPKPRTVLIRLLLEPGVLVSTDALVDAVWEERAPLDAAKNVQIYVARMRKVLPNGLLVSGANGYFADCPPAAVDALRYDHLIRSARAAMSEMELDTALDHFRAAAGLWRGDVLADVRYATFAQSPIAYYEQLRDAAREDEVGLRLEAGQGSELVPELERLVRDGPFRERRWGQLMVAYYQAGLQSEALRTFERMRQTFVEEMGLDPSPEMRALEQRILHHDPALTPSTRRAAPLPVVPAVADFVCVASTASSDDLREMAGGDPTTVLGGATRALTDDPGARAAIMHVDRRSLEAEAMLAFARPGELVVSQDAQSALIDIVLEPRRLTPAGFVTTSDGGSSAVYLCRWKSDDDASMPASHAVRRGVLPSYRNAFIGRRAEIDSIGSALADAGAVTLVGPGGIGKTRLAVEFAGSASGYDDGVWLVDAVGLDRADAFWPKLLDVLAINVHVPTAEAVADALRGRTTLVVFDNCEPVAGTVAELVDALAGVDGVRSIATSRTRLGTRGERIVKLEPLEWGDDGEAAELLVARAAELGIDLGEEPLVERLCAAVAGMPLAIELAVAQLGHLSVRELLERMDDQPRTLTMSPVTTSPASRHGSLQATFESSLDLLSGPARQALLASSVLRGDFDLSTVAAVCSDDAETVARELVGASLWSSIPAAERRTRYRQLEPIRQFTYSRLLTSPAADGVHARHAEYFVNLAHRPDVIRRAGDADNLFANLAAAYEWCRAGRCDELAARIATAMLSVPSMMPKMRNRPAPAGEPEGGHR